MYYSQFGSTNGTMPYGEGMSTIPGPNDDVNGTSTDGNTPWCDGALWQYVDPSTGDISMYMCITCSPGAAVWRKLSFA